MTYAPPVTSAAPRWATSPSASSNAAAEAIALAASAGLHLDPWQADVLRLALGERADGRWSAFEVGAIVPRQNGKGSILEARELAGLFLFGERLILHSAHEFKTAQEAYRRIRFLIENTPDLRRQVRRFLASSVATSVELHNGARLNFVARSKGSGRGFSGDLIILDEAYNLSSEMIDAMLPTLSARPNPQVWYTSSAPLAGEESNFLRSFCLRARAANETGRVAYAEWAAADFGDEVDLDDEALWHAANPGLGIRVSTEFIRDVERQTQSETGFARERLGIWRPDEDLGEQVIPPAAWDACRAPEHVRGDAIAYAIDATPDLTSGSIAVSDGTVAVVVEHHPGTAWIVPKLARLLEATPGPVYLDPRSPAGALLVELREEGIERVDVTPAEHAQACGGLLGAVLFDGTPLRFAHSGQAVLDAAVKGATRRPYGEAWAWNRRSAKVDISPLVAVTLARWAALNLPGGTEADFYTI